MLLAWATAGAIDKSFSRIVLRRLCFTLSIKTVLPALGKCKRQKWVDYGKKVLDVVLLAGIIPRSHTVGEVYNASKAVREIYTERTFGSKITIKEIRQAASSVF